MQWEELTETMSYLKIPTDNTHATVYQAVGFTWNLFIKNGKGEVVFSQGSHKTQRQAEIACERWIRNNINKDKKFLRPTEVLR